MRSLALVATLAVLMLTSSCATPSTTPSQSPAPSAAVVTPAATPSVVQVKNAQERYEFMPQSAFVKVNKAGTEAVLWMYDQESSCKNASEPNDIGPEFRGVKLSLVSDKPITAGPQKSDGLWILARKKADKEYSAGFWGANSKVTLDQVSLDDGAKIAGSFENVDGEAFLKCARFTATVCREK